MIKNIAHVVSGVVQNIFISEVIPDSDGINIYVEYSNENAATLGGVYNAEANVFIGLKPFESWTLNEESCSWNPPTPLPSDVGTGTPPKMYEWDEITHTWFDITPTE
jgi:hypothetical protein